MKTQIPSAVNIALGRAANWQPTDDEDNEEDLEKENALTGTSGQGTGQTTSVPPSGGSGKAGATSIPKRPGKADSVVGLRRDATEAYDSFQRGLPQKFDRFGNLVTPETQFGGGTGDLRRIYPEVSGVGGGYFQSYASLAKDLGQDPNVLASTGGFVGRGSRAAGLSQVGNQIRNIADNATYKSYATDLSNLQALQKLIRQYLAMGGGGGVPMPKAGGVQRTVGLQRQIGMVG